MPPSALGNGMLQGGSLVLLLPLYNLHALKHINNVVNTAALHAQFQRSLVQGNDGGAALAIFPQKALTQETQGLVLAAVCQLRSIHPAACMHTDVLTHNASTSRTQPVHEKIGKRGGSKLPGCTATMAGDPEVCTHAQAPGLHRLLWWTRARASAVLSVCNGLREVRVGT